MKRKPTIREMTPAEELEIEQFSEFAQREADEGFPGTTFKEKEENAAFYHLLMDNEMISRGLRVKINE